MRLIHRNPNHNEYTLASDEASDYDEKPLLPEFTSVSRSFMWQKKVLIIFLVIFGLILLVVGDLKLIRAGMFDQSVEGKNMVIYSMPETLVTRAQGMFADFLAVIGALKYGLDNDALSVRIVFDNAFYVDRDVGNNWWEYFFESKIPLKSEKRQILSGAVQKKINDKSNDVHFTNYHSRFGKIGSFSQVITKGYGITKNAYPASLSKEELLVFYNYPYPVNGLVSLAETRDIVQTHIRVHEHIQTKVHDIFHKEMQIHANSDFVIGVHYRGLDKVDAYPFRPVPADLYKSVINAVQELYKPSSWKLLIASDTQDFVDWASTIWGKDHVRARNIQRIKLNEVEWQADGNPVPLHKTTKVKPYEKAESTVIDMLLLSKASYIIKNRSSLSDTALAFMNQNQNYTMMLGPFDPIYSSDVRMPLMFRINEENPMDSLRQR